MAKSVIIILLVLLGVQSYFLLSSYADKSLSEYHYAQMALIQASNTYFMAQEEKPSNIKKTLLCNVVGNFFQYESTFNNTRDYVRLHKHEVESEFEKERYKVSQLLGKDIAVDQQYFENLCYGHSSNE